MNDTLTRVHAVSPETEAAGRLGPTAWGVTVLAVVWWLLPMAACAQGVLPEVFDRSAAELRRAVEAGRIAGVAHLVVRDGVTICLQAAGFADFLYKTPFTADSILRIYSMSKPITSVAATAGC